MTTRMCAGAIHPLRMFVREQRRYGDRHVFAPLSRFLPAAVMPCLERVSPGRCVAAFEAGVPAAAKVDVAAKLRCMW